MKESELEQKIVRLCRDNGLLTYKFTSPSSRGVPDRIVMGKGVCVFMEIKRPGKKPTALQSYEMDRISAAGIPAWHIDSMEKAKKFLNVYFTSEIIA